MKSLTDNYIINKYRWLLYLLLLLIICVPLVLYIVLLFCGLMPSEPFKKTDCKNKTKKEEEDIVDSLMERIKKYWWLLLLLSVGVPLLLYCLLSHFESFIDKDKLKYGDLIQYYGALLGSAATIVAIYITIGFTRKEQRLAVKPFLWSRFKQLLAYTQESLDDFTPQKENWFALHSSEQTFVDDSVIWSEYEKFMPSNAIDDDLSNKAMKWQDFIQKYTFIMYSLHNYGAGHAINVQFRCKSNPSSIDLTSLLPTNDKRTFLFILPVAEWLPNGTNEVLIELRFSYQDVLLITKYKQKDRVKFYREGENEYKISSVKPMSKPKEI